MKITIEAEDSDVHRICGALERLAAHEGDSNVRLLDRLADIAERAYVAFSKQSPEIFGGGDPSN